MLDFVESAMVSYSDPEHLFSFVPAYEFGIARYRIGFKFLQP